jgi:hypothetical protein
VAQPKDEFDADSFRNPELNPLMNPLLSANMGRWAEVYFTTIPEKREQAIYELILELRNNQPPERVSPKVIENKRTTDTIEQAEPEKAAAQQSELTCAKCGERNPIDHRFCGTCGAPLVAGEITFHEHGAPRVKAVAAKATAKDIENSSRRDRGQQVTPRFLNSTPEDTLQPAIGSAQSYPSYSDFRLFAVEPEPVPNRRRKYVSVILTVLAAALIYWAWRRSHTVSEGSASSPDRSQPVASVPPAAAGSSPQPSAGPNADSTSGSVPPLAPRAVIPRAVVPRATVPRSSANRRVPHSRRPADGARPARPVVLASEKSPATSAGVSGAQEFAVAERYLKGNDGRSRNSAEAAQWLWRAVGKGNVDAILTLSDLYLRGDGVPKNCDQGRVLLDAAARKGNATAADRIRHLQNFGCR